MKPYPYLAAGILGSLVATPAAAQVDLLSPDTGLMIWTVVVFVIVLYLLGKFAYPHILRAVEEREQTIRDLIEEARQDRAEAAALLEKQRGEFETVRGQTQKILADSREAAERAREEMLSETRKQQDEMLARTRNDIESQKRLAVEEVRQEAVAVAIAAAEKLIERNLDEEDNRRLVEQYLSRLEGESSTVAAGV